MNIKRYALHCVVALAIFMEMLDSTILNTAIPSMSASLHVSPINLKIALISYLLMLAIFIPISGWTADKWGAKKIFLIAMAIFTLSSFACGFSHTLTELIIMRCFQGIGAAFMAPIARLLLVRSVARTELVKVMSQVMTLAALGVMLGPVLGGFITEYFSWPWIFFLNIPIGIIAMVITYIGLDKVEIFPVSKFDTLGFLLFGFGLALFIFGLSALSENGFPLYYSLSSISIALVLLLLYVLYARRKKHTVINIELFSFASFRISILGNLFSRIGFGGMPFLLPLLLQINFHYSPADSGLLLMPMAVGIMVSRQFTPALLRYLGYRCYLVSNTILVSLAVASFALISAETSWIIITILTFIFGVLISQQYSGMNALAYQELNQQQLSSATSCMGTLIQFSQSFGVAVAALLLHLGLVFSTSNTLTLEIFKWTFIILGLLTLASTPIFLKLNNDNFTPKASV